METKNTNKNKETKLSTSPYKGTSDSYPEEMFYRNYLFNIWERVAKRFGYEEYDTPLVEEASIYKAKSGEELANKQLYTFVDKGGREIAIRPEMTPSLARIIAAKRKGLRLPLRLFNIGRFYRYEKPQRGRTREFFQLNIDILGVGERTSEVEIIQFIMAVMQELKAPKETYELRISSRYLLDYLYDEVLKVSEDQRGDITKAIDIFPKIEAQEFKEYLKDLELTEEQVTQLEEFVRWDIDNLKEIKEKSRAAEELLNLFSFLEELEITNVKFCPYIVRGLDYYTGTVMEMFDIGGDKNPRALFGGGRYDNLLEIFGEDKIPAFGLGWGDITTLDYLKTYNLLPPYSPNTKLFVTLMDKNDIEESFKTASFLREKGINTEVQLEEAKLSKQLDYANKRSIPWVLIVGEEERKKGKVLLKNMKTSEQLLIPLTEVPEKIG
jgi:histidyl-tRNA synthetase